MLHIGEVGYAYMLWKRALRKTACIPFKKEEIKGLQLKNQSKNLVSFDLNEEIEEGVKIEVLHPVLSRRKFF